MPRNLDLTALRAFLTVADTGGITRAAGFLNLTQSAVSMQIKRLEEALDAQLFDRSGRQIALTASGEQLLGYARRMLQLNDEVLARMTDDGFEGEIVLGVPHDIVYPTIPQVLSQFHSEFPRVKVQLISSHSRELKELFAAGKCDIILTTETSVTEGGEALVEKELIWKGAPGGHAWKQRPLRLAFEYNCIFRSSVQEALDAADIPWEMAVESSSSRTIDASVSADLAVHVGLDGADSPYMAAVPHGGQLPRLESYCINLYVATARNPALVEALTGLVRQGFCGRRNAGAVESTAEGAPLSASNAVVRPAVVFDSNQERHSRIG